MPHAEDQSMSTPTVNGEKPSSAFLSHLTSIPVVHDSIVTFKGNALGQMSIGLADQSYQALAKPLLPYLARPYQYVSPYVHRADSLADSGLRKVEETFPVVRSPTDTLTRSLLHTVFLPARVAFESKDYVFKTYDDQYRSIHGGDGLVKAGKAVVTTGFVVTSDSLTWLSAFLAAKKEQTKQVVNEKTVNRGPVENHEVALGGLWSAAGPAEAAG
ncbi:MAG: hypothetical protein M1826_003748 [Phylliscum demangeonii]|nr:MAG: hypothetical protein M1826_003748 [Phylliscum demangeonii]